MNKLTWKKRPNVGQKIISLYFIFYYLIPLLGNYLFSQEITSAYIISPATLLSIVKIIVIYCGFLSLSYIHFTLDIPKSFIKPLDNIIILYKRYRLIFALIVLVFAMMFFIQGLNVYRYHTGIIEYHSSILIVCIILNLIATIDMLHHIFVRNYKNTIDARTYIENLLLILSLFLFFTGTQSLIIAILILIFSISPSKTHKVLFRDEEKMKLKNIFYQYLKGVFLLCFTVSLAWLGGETMKMMTESSSIKKALYKIKESTSSLESFPSRYNLRDQETKVDDGKQNHYALKKYLLYLLERNSISYYSLVFTSQSEIYKNYIDEHPIIYIFKTFLFRLNYITGGFFEMVRPPIGSISQLNYFFLVKDNFADCTIDQIKEKIAYFATGTGLRVGSSPGLIASFDYMFSMPLNIFFCIIYLVIISRLLNAIFLNYKSNGNLSLLGLIILLQFVQVLFQSPFDFLTLIDNSSLFVALLFLMSMYENAKESYI